MSRITQFNQSYFTTDGENTPEKVANWIAGALEELFNITIAVKHMPDSGNYPAYWVALPNADGTAQGDLGIYITKGNNTTITFTLSDENCARTFDISGYMYYWVDHTYTQLYTFDSLEVSATSTCRFFVWPAYNGYQFDFILHMSTAPELLVQYSNTKIMTKATDGTDVVFRISSYSAGTYNVFCPESAYSSMTVGYSGNLSGKKRNTRLLTPLQIEDHVVEGYYVYEDIYFIDSLRFVGTINYSEAESNFIDAFDIDGDTYQILGVPSSAGGTSNFIRLVMKKP